MSTPSPRPLNSDELERLAAATGLDPTGPLMLLRLAPVVETILAERAAETELVSVWLRARDRRCAAARDLFVANQEVRRLGAQVSALTAGTRLAPLDQPEDGV